LDDLSAAMLRLAVAVLPVVGPQLAERAMAGDAEAAGDVDTLAGLLGGH
jgi:hypothetical protein